MEGVQLLRQALGQLTQFADLYEADLKRQGDLQQEQSPKRQRLQDEPIQLEIQGEGDILEPIDEVQSLEIQDEDDTDAEAEINEIDENLLQQPDELVSGAYIPLCLGDGYEYIFKQAYELVQVLALNADGSAYVQCFRLIDQPARIWEKEGVAKLANIQQRWLRQRMVVKKLDPTRVQVCKAGELDVIEQGRFVAAIVQGDRPAAEVRLYQTESTKGFARTGRLLERDFKSAKQFAIQPRKGPQAYRLSKHVEEIEAQSIIDWNVPIQWNKKGTLINVPPKVAKELLARARNSLKPLV